MKLKHVLIALGLAASPACIAQKLNITHVIKITTSEMVKDQRGKCSLIDAFENVNAGGKVRSFNSCALPASGARHEDPAEEYALAAWPEQKALGHYRSKPRETHIASETSRFGHRQERTKEESVDSKAATPGK